MHSKRHCYSLAYCIHGRVGCRYRGGGLCARRPGGLRLSGFSSTRRLFVCLFVCPSATIASATKRRHARGTVRGLLRAYGVYIRTFRESSCLRVPPSGARVRAHSGGVHPTEGGHVGVAVVRRHAGKLELPLRSPARRRRGHAPAVLSSRWPPGPRGRGDEFLLADGATWPQYWVLVGRRYKVPIGRRCHAAAVLRASKRG
eukprot:12242-Pyramimonas_sp.AAC.1